jgi:hypothetical protein
VFAVFDKHKPLREKVGAGTEHVCRNVDNPKEIILWFDDRNTGNRCANDGTVRE